MKITLSLMLVFLVTSCGPMRETDTFVSKKITTSRVIAITGSRAPWVYEIEKRLRKNGFRVKRVASQSTTIEKVSNRKTDIYNESSARYVMVINGYSRERCFGGGYNFGSIDVELIDVADNETVMHYINSGYSENCVLSGEIFGDIEKIIVGLWKQREEEDDIGRALEPVIEQDKSVIEQDKAVREQGKVAALLIRR